MVRSDPEGRLGALLNLAGHSGTPYREARVAIEGCRAILRRHPQLRQEYGLRVALTAAGVEMREAGIIAARTTAQLAENTWMRNSDS